LIFDVIVAEAHRRSGLGRRLIDHVLNHSMLADVRHIELYCKPELIPFYERWGFTSPGPDVNYLRMTRGA
jgi:predicted GNAT family N-acyltransferase